MAEDSPQDRSTPRRERPEPEPAGVAPGPLLAAMGSLILILLVASWLTQQWQFLLLGLFGVAAGVLPFINRRR